MTRAQWLADRQAELLPVPYFHIVFTLPASVAGLALQNKAVVYDMLFRAAAETVQTIAADPKHLGATTGMTAVLHTWGQNLFHHPHIHCIVPGGGLSPELVGNYDRRPSEQRVKWIDDLYFASQIPGIMTPRRTPAASAPPRCI